MSFNRKDYNDVNWLGKNRHDQNPSGLHFPFNKSIRPWIRKGVTFTQILAAHVTQSILATEPAREMTHSYSSECCED